MDVSVDWDDVIGADDYLIRWRAHGPGQTLNDGIRSPSSETVVTVLSHGRYVVRVQACDQQGCGAPSATQFTTKPAPIESADTSTIPPPRPSGLSVRDTPGSTAVNVNWDDTPGSDEYLVRYRRSGSSVLSDGAYPAESRLQLTVPSYGRWVVRVQACNQAGCGKPTARAFSTAAAETPPQPSAGEDSSSPVRSVCDRTSQVRDALMSQTGKSCDSISDNDLAAVGGLDLSSSGLRSITDDDFAGLSRLRSLNLKNNPSLRSVSANAFSDLDSLVNVNLEGARLGSLSATQFANNTNLVSLHLSGNRLTTLPAGVFSGSTNLGFIDLSRNALTSVPSTVFSGLDNLWFLDMGRNSLASLSANMFSDLSSLEQLKLDNQFGRDANHRPTTHTLTSIPAGVFNGLSAVTDLDLANNAIASLPNNLFAPLTSLERMSLFGNAAAPFDLTGKGVRSGAQVLQVAASPTGFTANPTENQKVKLRYDDPGNSNISHQFRHLSNGTWSAWADITGQFKGANGQWQVNLSGLSAGTGYLFELRSKVGTAFSWRAKHPKYNVMFGTASADTLTGSAYSDEIAGAAGNDTIKGGPGADYLRGGAGDDTLWANGTNRYGGSGDKLEGGAGDDTLRPGLGSDTLKGGAGTDTVSYAHLGSHGVIVNMIRPARSTSDAYGDTFDSIEKIVGTAGDDVLIGNSKSNSISGDTGNDRLISTGGTDTLDGGSGTDEFFIFPGFGDITINNHQSGEQVTFCIDGPTNANSAPPSSQDEVLTIVDRGGRQMAGSVTIPGPFPKNYSTPQRVEKTDGEICQGALAGTAESSGENEPLRVWWVQNTPQIIPSTNAGNSALRAFIRVATNKRAGATAALHGVKNNKDDTNCDISINSPPFTLVSLTPILLCDADDINAETVRATDTATAGDETANAMVQEFQIGGPLVRYTTMSGGDSKVAVAWEAYNARGQAAAFNEHKVQYRVLDRAGGSSTGAWTDAATISSTANSPETQSATITGLTNGTTYEVRVRVRNNAADTDSSTHWVGPWSYDLIAPQAYFGSDVPVQTTGVAAAAGTDSTSLDVSWSNWVYDGRPAVHYYQVDYKTSSATLWTTGPKVAGTNGVTLTGLTANTAYNVRVRANNVNGAGPYSSTASATTSS